MNFQQLSYIVAVDRHRHFGQASEACHVTQATLSAMVKRLEEEIGASLFDRSRKPVVPTSIGKEVVAMAKQILDKEQELRNIAASDGIVGGTLRIGVIPTVANALLPIIIAPMRERNSGLTLDIVEMRTAQVISQLRTGQIDMGVLATPIKDDDFFFHPLYREAMMVYGVKEKKKRYMMPKDLKGENVWLLEEGHCFREQALTICEMRAASNSLDNLTFTGGSFDTLLHLTDRFGGFTMVPELYAEMLSTVRKKKVRHFRSPRPLRQISALTYRAEEKKDAVEAVCQVIREEVRPRMPVFKGKTVVMGVGM